MINNNTERSISNFGLNLFRIREEKHFTREQLAEAIGLADQRIIYDYENGVKRPKVATLVLIANALGVTIDSMFLK